MARVRGLRVATEVARRARGRAVVEARGRGRGRAGITGRVGVAKETEADEAEGASAAPKAVAIARATVAKTMVETTMSSWPVQTTARSSCLGS